MKLNKVLNIILTIFLNYAYLFLNLNENAATP